ncbi:hypothetical protein Hanom_Chr07g00615971 [Helianthus anomalus]
MCLLEMAKHQPKEHVKEYQHSKHPLSPSSFPLTLLGLHKPGFPPVQLSSDLLLRKFTNKNDISQITSGY